MREKLITIYIGIPLIIFSSICFAQNENPTKQQTLAFISKTINTYFEDFHLANQGYDTHDIQSVNYDIKSGRIDIGLKSISQDNRRIHINKLTFHVIDVKPNSYSIDAREFLTEFVFYLNPNAVKLYDEKNQFINALSKLNMHGDANVPIDVPARLGKALNHAYKLYGGKDDDLFK